MSTVSTRAQEQIKPAGKSRAKFVIGGGIIVLAILLLIVNSFKGASAYYITVSELNSKGADAVGQSWRVSGPVDKDSVQYDAQILTLQFNMTEDDQQLAVVYHDVMPDLFMKSTSVIVEGQVNSTGLFEAQTILVKCPSKYQSELTEGTPVPQDHLQNSAPASSS